MVVIAELLAFTMDNTSLSGGHRFLMRFSGKLGESLLFACQKRWLLAQSERRALRRCASLRLRERRVARREHADAALCDGIRLSVNADNPYADEVVA